MAKRNHSVIARKAVATRKARDEFFAKNELAYTVAELTAKGVGTQEIADALGVTDATVRAVKANATRGTYEPYVGAWGWSGTCNF